MSTFADCYHDPPHSLKEMGRDEKANCGGAVRSGLGALFSLVIGRQDPVPAARVAGFGNRQVHASIKDLMDSVIDPSADVLWGAAGTIVDKDESIQELSPKTPEEWLEMRRAAVRIIEGGPC